MNLQQYAMLVDIQDRCWGIIMPGMECDYNPLALENRDFFHTNLMEWRDEYSISLIKSTSFLWNSNWDAISKQSKEPEVAFSFAIVNYVLGKWSNNKPDLEEICESVGSNEDFVQFPSLYREMKWQMEWGVISLSSLEPLVTLSSASTFQDLLPILKPLLFGRPFDTLITLQKLCISHIISTVHQKDSSLAFTADFVRKILGQFITDKKGDEWAGIGRGVNEARRILKGFSHILLKPDEGKTNKDYFLFVVMHHLLECQTTSSHPEAASQTISRLWKTMGLQEIGFFRNWAGNDRSEGFWRFESIAEGPA